MCGIVGVIAKNKGGLFKGQITMFGQLFWADQLRGTDGAGMFFDGKSGIRVIKMPNEASELIATASYEKALEDAVREGHFIIGHNRAATKGKLTWENTHPFREGGITLVHNGTLFSHKELDAEVAVDSHAICKHMSIHGHEETLKKVDGAFALVWHDAENKTLNLARNAQRPLHIVETGTSWIICSEAALGVWIAERNNQKVESVISLEIGHVYTFDEVDLSKYSKTKVELFVWKYSQTGADSFWNKAGSFDDTDDGTASKVITITPKKGKHGKHPAPEKPENKGSSASVHVIDQRSNVSQVRAWGTRVTFSPHRLVTANGKSTFSAIIWDQEKKTHFLKGRIIAEPNVEFRFYGEWVLLTHMAEWDYINGAVVTTRMTKNRIIHTISNPAKVEEVAKSKTLCTFCTDEIDEGKEQNFNGMVLCPTCAATFHDDPALAHECGMC